MKPNLFLAAAFAALAASAPLSAQVVTGRVLDDISDGAVDQAVVSALSGDSAVARARTAADGTYRLQLPAAGTYQLRAERIGYSGNTTAPVAVAAGATVSVDIRIAAEELALDPLQATGRSERRSPRLERNGFYERKNGGFGRFVTAEDIARQRPLEVSDVLRGMPGVRVVPGNRPNSNYIVMSRAGGNCSPRIFMDNMEIQSEEIDDVIQPEHISGLEVYRGASETPPRYGGINSPCGAIVIWTKTGDEP
jgi:hypothetical protein